MENQNSLSASRPSGLLQSGLLGAGLFSFSILTWIAVCVIAERREAWDSGAYFAIVLPLLCIVSGLAGWRRPIGAWRWPTALLLGQALGMAITNHASLTLGPLVLVALAVPGVPCYVAALVAANRARAAVK